MRTSLPFKVATLLGYVLGSTALVVLLAEGRAPALLAAGPFG
ncbi:hypothetical protein [Janthinobacterium fluminis]|uniref:Uncharacterized protein n=1 Tax=Janthinobacterium fluminis TaxID=2987524 RepID=A0ABT5K0T9_9BURK|nr:hypothetical protein [Janthinobacterium fluminis]MDC8758570.1 hypothetical protein [Janthinobacterium fluminis]